MVFINNSQLSLDELAIDPFIQQTPKEIYKNKFITNIDLMAGLTDSVIY